MTRFIRKLSRFTRGEVNRAFERATRVLRHPAFTILVAPKQGEFARLLPVISRKVGNSPTRNLIRRRLKSIFYEQALFKGACDTIVIVRKPAADLPFEEMKRLIIRAITSERACTVGT